MSDKDDEATARERRILDIGKGVAAAAVGMLELHYDCNCLHCQTAVLKAAFMELANLAQDPDMVEVEATELMRFAWRCRREVRRQVAYAEACEAAGVSPGVANEKPV